MTRKIPSKIPAMIGLSLSLLSFSFVAAAFIDLAIRPQATQGMSTSFALWIYSAITAMLAVAAYQIDGVFNMMRAINDYRRAQHIMLAMVEIASLPIVVVVGGGLGINILIWNIYHFVLCVLEVISIIWMIKDRRSHRAGCSNDRQ